MLSHGLTPNTCRVTAEVLTADSHQDVIPDSKLQTELRECPDLCWASRVTRPPPLSPLQTSPVREVAHRLTVWLTRGTGHARLKMSSNRARHSD